MIQIISTIISAVALVLVAIIGRKSDSHQKNNNEYRKKREQAEKLRADENYLLMKIQLATLNLIYVTSLSVVEQSDRSLEEAQNEAREAIKEYESFVKKKAHFL